MGLGRAVNHFSGSANRLSAVKTLCVITASRKILILRAERGTVLNNFGISLSALGRRKEALTATTEVDVGREHDAAHVLRLHDAVVPSGMLYAAREHINQHVLLAFSQTTPIRRP